MKTELIKQSYKIEWFLEPGLSSILNPFDKKHIFERIDSGFREGSLTSKSGDIERNIVWRLLGMHSESVALVHGQMVDKKELKNFKTPEEYVDEHQDAEHYDLIDFQRIFNSGGLHPNTLISFKLNK